MFTLYFNTDTTERKRVKRERRGTGVKGEGL